MLTKRVTLYETCDDVICLDDDSVVEIDMPQRNLVLLTEAGTQRGWPVYKDSQVFSMHCRMQESLVRSPKLMK